MSKPSPPHSRAAGSTAARLLQAAADLLGSEAILARRLDVPQPLLARFMAGARELPPELLLRTVDIVLELQEHRGLALEGEASPRRSSDA